jgi:hypothetical protein
MALKNTCIITLLVAAFFVSCRSAKNAFKKATNNTYISIEQTPCFGECPIYKLTVYENGSALLDARRFMDSIGVFEAKVNLDTLCVTFEEAKKCKWETYDEEYISGYSDMPATVIQYSTNQRDTFTVRFEGERAPLQLLWITERLKSIKGAAKWKLKSEPI